MKLVSSYEVNGNFLFEYYKADKNGEVDINKVNFTKKGKEKIQQWLTEVYETPDVKIGEITSVEAIQSRSVEHFYSTPFNPGRNLIREVKANTSTGLHIINTVETLIDESGERYDIQERIEINMENYQETEIEEDDSWMHTINLFIHELLNYNRKEFSYESI